MKYIKLMANPFSRSTENNKLLTFGLIAGLAAGAVIAMLFTPKSGKDMRRQIADDVMNPVRGRHNTSSGGDKGQANHLAAQGANKKPKSDIKELLHEAHGAAHTEQGI